MMKSEIKYIFLTGGAVISMEDIFSFLAWGKWLIIVAIVFTILDFRFGVQEAKMKDEEIRFSRAVRRTLNKIVDYVCWIILSFSFGEAFGRPFGIELLPFIVLLVIYGLELESIFKHYFFVKGIKGKINIFKFFGKKTDIIEIEGDKENADENEKNI